MHEFFKFREKTSQRPSKHRGYLWWAISDTAATSVRYKLALCCLVCKLLHMYGFLWLWKITFVASAWKEGWETPE
jgi:hypothetical protein